MKNKILSLLLIVSLILPTYQTFAMEKNIRHCNSNNRPRYGTCIFVSTCVSALSLIGGYFLGYKNAQQDKINILKNIKLTGVSSLEGGAVPNGIIEPIPLAQRYIKNVLRYEIPKLSQSDEFPLCKLSVVEHYVSIIEGSGESEELSRALIALARSMQGYMYYQSEIPLGILVDFLKDSQKLVDQAYKEIYVDKKQKEL